MQINNFLTYLALNTDYTLTPQFEEFLCFEREGVKFLIDAQPNVEEADSIRLSAQIGNEELYYAYYDFYDDDDGLYAFGKSQEMVKSSEEFKEILLHCQTWLKELG